MKTFYYSQNIGKCRHIINFNDGVKTHSDGSPFYDVKVFGNKRELHKFMRCLIADGYIEQ